MYDLLNYPLVLFALSFLILWFTTRFGATIRRKRLMCEEIREDFNTVLATTLTLSGLIIGFSFSMAINRYEQRKNFEEAEANAIGTEFVRADLLAPEDAAQVQDAAAAVSRPATVVLYGSQPAAIDADRDPHRAAAERSVGRGAPQRRGAADGHRGVGGGRHERCLEFAGLHGCVLAQPDPGGRMGSDGGDRRDLAAIGRLWGAKFQSWKAPCSGCCRLSCPSSFLLIADIDSPRSGIIHVKPQNLAILAETLRGP